MQEDYVYLQEDLSDLCNSIELLKDDINRCYRLKFPMLFDDSESAKVFREQHQGSLDFDSEQLVKLQEELKNTVQKIKSNLPLKLTKRINKALSSD